MNWNTRRQLPRLATLTGLAVMLFTVSASATIYKGQFTINGPVQWGDVVLSPGTYEFTMPSATSPYQVNVRGNGENAVFFSSVSDVPAGMNSASAEAQLKLEKINGMPVVRSLLIPKLGMALEFAVPKEVKSLRGAQVPNGGSGCNGKT